MRNIFILSSSLRKNSNSEKMANAFALGAQTKGHTVKKVNLQDIDFAFCKGCLSCQKTGQCCIKDDVASLLPEIQESDILVFATPIYYYSVSGQLKTFLDRLNPMFGKPYRFREVYLIAAAADTDIHAVEGASRTVKDWISCFEEVTFQGCIGAFGITGPNEVEQKILQEAYQKGYEVK